MSKFVDEIIKDLKDNPDTFMHTYDGIEKGNVIVCNLLRFPPCVICRIDGTSVGITFVDNWRLVSAVKKWRRVVRLDTLTKAKKETFEIKPII